MTPETPSSRPTFGAALSQLSPKSKLIAFVVALVVGCILVAASGMIFYRVAFNRYSKKEAARMKQVQDLLAAADAADKRAEAKEQEAARLKAVNDAKAKTTTAEKEQIESEAQRNDEQIRNAYQHDHDAISDCDRCKDICTRLDAVAVSNADLAKYKCAADSCAEQCDTGAN
jgi:uncharacterized protein HemX